MFARLGTMATRRTRHVVSALSRLLLVVLLLVCNCLGCTLATAAASPSALESQGSGEVASGWLATLLMSLAAGLATGIGGAAAVVLGRSPGPTAMARSLAFAGGVMLTVSVFDMWWPIVSRPLTAADGSRLHVVLMSVLQLGVGAALYGVLAQVMPEEVPLPHVVEAAQRGAKTHTDDDNNNGANHSDVENGDADGHGLRHSGGDDDKRGLRQRTRRRRWRLAIMMMVTLTLHNFPEGVAVAVSSMQSWNLGGVVAIAIAIHNIPEGLAIAVPVLSATGRPRLAVGMALASGLSEPLGAFLTLVLLKPVFNITGEQLGGVLCGVAGVMSCVSCVELLPQALQHGSRYDVGMGALAGFGITLLSLLLGA